tara:strand:- start:212 stop:349 length:138 start_codon:yes stop_codon:yes gene_type:complete
MDKPITARVQAAIKAGTVQQPILNVGKVSPAKKMGKCGCSGKCKC